MDWFRHYHRSATDPKFHRIKLRVGCPRGLVCGAWWAILEAASEATPRGTLAKFAAGDLAYLADIRVSLAEKLLQAFRDEGLITPENVVANWAKRQKNSDNVAERVSKHRARTANPLELAEGGTPGNVTVTHRTEQNRTEKKEPPPSPTPETVQGHPARPRAAPAEVGEEFEELWQRYPRKVDKQAGRKAYLKARKAAPHATILAALEVYIRQITGRDPEKIKHPASWLNAQDWADPHVADAAAPFAARSPPSRPGNGTDVRDLARQGIDPYAIPVRPNHDHATVPVDRDPRA